MAAVIYPIGVRRGLVEIKNPNHRYTCSFCGANKLPEVYVSGIRFLVDPIQQTLHRCVQRAEKSWEPKWIKQMRKQIQQIKRKSLGA